MIYFLQCNGENGPIKIGYSTNADTLTTRMEDFSTGNPYPLRLLGTITHASEMDEHALQRRFASLRLRGEWFNGDYRLKAYIRQACARERAGVPPIRQDWVRPNSYDAAYDAALKREGLLK